MNAQIVQLIATLTLMISNIFKGFNVAWCSYTIPLLESKESQFLTKITQYETNLMGSMFMLGCLVTTVVGGYISNCIGRKRSEILCGIFSILSWSIISSAPNVTQILVGRLIAGFGSGLHCVIQYVFISEISQTSIKGALASLPGFGYCLGVLFSYIVGWLLSYQVINYLCLTLSVIHVFLVSMLKETPGYLLSKGQYKQALQSLKFYRGTSETTPEILEEIGDLSNHHEQATDFKLRESDVTVVMNKVEQEQKLNPDTTKLEKGSSYDLNKTTQKNISMDTKISQWKIMYKSKSSQRAILIISLHIILITFMGVTGIQTYAGVLFARAAPNISPHLCSTILAVATLLGAGLFSVLCNIFGRRMLMMTSCAASSLTLMVLASLLRWSWAPEWMIPAVVLLFCFVFHLGAFSVPFIQISESFVPEIISLASTIAVCNMYIANSVLLVVFRPIVQHLGLDWTFFIFSIFSAITTITTFLFIKETKGVSLELVQRMYEHGYLYRSKLYSRTSTEKS